MAKCEIKKYIFGVNFLIRQISHLKKQLSTSKTMQKKSAHFILKMDFQCILKYFFWYKLNFEKI